MYLRHINPVGRADVPLLNRTLDPGEVFEVDDKVGRHLLEQKGNYQRAKPDEKEKGADQ